MKYNQKTPKTQKPPSISRDFGGVGVERFELLTSAL
tara:strand:+ start:1147 stop:1254 length:108 start_codon:yes stop_codon:yes gene_type:complete